MSEKNKAVVHRWTDEMNRGNLAAIDKFYSPDLVDHSAPPGLPPGIEGGKQILNMFFAAFPDIHLTVEDLVAEGDKVAQRWTVRGTHKGDFMGIAPTGKQITLSAMTIERFVGGKIVERWEVFDQLGMMQQLGVIPPPEQLGR